MQSLNSLPTIVIKITWFEMLVTGIITSSSGQETDPTKKKECSASSALSLMDSLYTALIALQYPMEDPALHGNGKGKNMQLYELSENRVKLDSIRIFLLLN